MDSPYTMYGYNGFCSLFRNLRHDGAPSTAVAGHAAKVECDLHAADKARVMDIPDPKVGPELFSSVVR